MTLSFNVATLVYCRDIVTIVLQYCTNLYGHPLTTIPVGFFHSVGSLSPKRTQNVETPVQGKFRYDLIEWWVSVNETLQHDIRSNVAKGVSAG